MSITADYDYGQDFDLTPVELTAADQARWIFEMWTPEYDTPEELLHRVLLWGSEEWCELGGAPVPADERTTIIAELVVILAES